MEQYQVIQLLVAFLSVVATCFAAVAAFVMPRSAAKFAENLRAQNDSLDRLKIRKEQIFIELIQVRGLAISRNAVSAMNLIDYVFLDSPKVRDAYSELYNVYQRSTVFSEQQGKLEALIAAITEDMGVEQTYRHGDISRVYVPKKISDEQEAEQLELKLRLGALRERNLSSSNASN